MYLHLLNPDFLQAYMAAKVTAVAWTTKPTLELSKSPKLAAKSVPSSLKSTANPRRADKDAS